MRLRLASQSYFLSLSLYVYEAHVPDTCYSDDRGAATAIND